MVDHTGRSTTDVRSSSGGSTTLSTHAISNIVDRLKYEGNRGSTRKNYHTIWKIFAQFYANLDTKPNNWEDRIVLFAA